MKVNIITLTIAFFVTENSAIDLKNFLKVEDLTDKNYLLTEDSGATANKITDIKKIDSKIIKI
jgi:hypothetical protein